MFSIHWLWQIPLCQNIIFNFPEKYFSGYSSEYKQFINTLKNQKNEITATHVLNEKNHCVYFGRDLFVPHLHGHTMILYEPETHQFVVTGKYLSHDGTTPIVRHEPLDVVHDDKHDWEDDFSLLRDSTVLLGDKMQAVGWKVKNTPENWRLLMGEMRVLYQRKYDETDVTVDNLLQFNPNQCPSEYLWVVYVFKKVD